MVFEEDSASANANDKFDQVTQFFSQWEVEPIAAVLRDHFLDPMLDVAFSEFGAAIKPSASLVGHDVVADSRVDTVEFIARLCDEGDALLRKETSGRLAKLVCESDTCDILELAEKTFVKRVTHNIKTIIELRGSTSAVNLHDNIVHTSSSWNSRDVVDFVNVVSDLHAALELGVYAAEKVKVGEIPGVAREGKRDAAICEVLVSLADGMSVFAKRFASGVLLAQTQGA